MTNISQRRWDTIKMFANSKRTCIQQSIHGGAFPPYNTRNTADICASLKSSNNGNCVIKVEGERFLGSLTSSLGSTKRTLDPSGQVERKDLSMVSGRRTRYTSLDSDRVVFMKYPWVSGNRQMVLSGKQQRYAR